MMNGMFEMVMNLPCKEQRMVRTGLSKGLILMAYQGKYRNY
jgi:hypothetical protein